MLHTWANPDGTQRIEDTGPLTKKRMETCDEEFRDAAVDFIKRQHEAQTPFFVWFNATHMHFRTHPKPESIGRAGRWQSEYHDTMLDHDDLVGSLLDLLDELGLADNTIVMYSTDNGPHMNTWPDGAMTPYRNEKNSNWEGAYRVPAMVRWPARIPAGTVLNGIVSHNDWFVTLLSAAGVPDIADKLRTGTDLGGTTYKVHLDGNDQLAYITGETDESPRQHFFYVNDDGGLTGLRFDNWKFVFLEQRCPGTLQIWAEPFTELRVPKLFNLRTDPYERADITSNTYWDWMADHMFLFVPAQAYLAQMLQTFVEFPQRQKSASFNLEQVMAKLQDGAAELSLTAGTREVMCPEWCLPTPEHGSGRHPSRMTATTPGGPKPKPSSNSKPSDTKSLSNHSPKSPNTCRSHPPATGHQIFSSETQAAPICGGSRAFWVCSCKEKARPHNGTGLFRERT